MQTYTGCKVTVADNYTYSSSVSIDQHVESVFSRIISESIETSRQVLGLLDFQSTDSFQFSSPSLVVSWETLKNWIKRGTKLEEYQ